MRYNVSWSLYGRCLLLICGSFPVGPRLLGCEVTAAHADAARAGRCGVLLFRSSSHSNVDSARTVVSGADIPCITVAVMTQLPVLLVLTGRVI